MMLGLRVYCYASGVFSSRVIEGMTYENVARFRPFSLRRQIKAGLEWTLVCLAYNLRRLHRVITTRQSALQTAL